MIDCNKAGPPQKERSVSTDATVRAEYKEACPAAGQDFHGAELDSSWSQCAGADCTTTELPQEAHEFVGSVAKGETGMMGLDRLCGSLSHPAKPVGGSTRAEWSLMVGKNR